jgi:superfamily II RNA helicase
MQSESNSLLQMISPSGGEALSDGDLLDRFVSYVESKGLKLYPAQEEAILSLFDGHNVILNTPTGSGKSLVALAQHFYALARGQKSFYTCPIKALVNEKFLALCQDFGAESVGMITGDASVNPSAPIICCTAEILANLALREGEATDVSDVIMDEFHYYSDPERGVAWQVPLLTLPNARFMLMSATLGDVSLFERSLTALNRRPTTVVRSVERPVPLTFAYQETPLHETVQNLVSSGKAPVYLVSFTQREASEQAQNLLSVDILNKDEKRQIAEFLTELGIKFSSPFGKEMQKLLKHGIGLHHAGLLPKYRYVVERLAQKGFLKVVSGTDTLGVGVNVPIRTVLFTKLCKFDGNKVGILSVRDFKQIAGRAGRKGFDDQGYVVVQAPEHVIDNLRLEAKAIGDPKKLKRIVRKKPPEKGFVMWTKETMEKLISAEPEALVSRFRVSHGMLLNVLSRPGDGCGAMRQLIADSHEHAGSKRRQKRTAFQMFRSLLDRKIVEFTDEPAAAENHRLKLRVNVDLQEDFSIHHALALYLIDTVKLVDPNDENYALNLLTLAESIVENPDLILRRQLDRIRNQKFNEMKQEGVDFEERMAELEKLEYPKPMREFIYQTFNEFSAKHPWVGQDNIRPKSIARDMYEQYMSFGEYVREYELHRSEGLLLRYLAEVYKVLVQTLPATCKDENMQEIIDYFGVLVKGVDSTLLDEWEKIRSGGAVQTKTVEHHPKSQVDWLSDEEFFRRAIRTETYRYVRAFGNGQFWWILQSVREYDTQIQPREQIPRNFPIWTEELLSSRLVEYRAEHVGPLTDASARRAYFEMQRLEDNQFRVCQGLVDEQGDNDWVVEFVVDIEACRSVGLIGCRLLAIRAI